MVRRQEDDSGGQVLDSWQSYPPSCLAVTDLDPTPAAATAAWCGGQRQRGVEAGGRKNDME
ncbi:hypothetical protein E2562_037665 [Oryza meyeriana var. granulata]|uniref:Uncharacterized protein n=1 Tax=Oryza meyeriana var. granulata TaxID=110450 RepID=A0A6G1ETS6_9ORYZ|nr:hypothetical protein E2562_037665 [Oryza meyeriana var. granulata]